MSSARKLAITGTSGFKGRHLVPALHREGSQTLSLGRKCIGATGASGRGGATRNISLDLREEGQIQHGISVERPDVVIHLAATRGHGDAAGKYAAWVELNLLATVRPLRAAHEAGVGRIILMGFAEEYCAGNPPAQTHSSTAADILPAADCPLPTANCPLPTAHCQLLQGKKDVWPEYADQDLKERR